MSMYYGCEWIVTHQVSAHLVVTILQGNNFSWRGTGPWGSRNVIYEICSIQYIVHPKILSGDPGWLVKIWTSQSILG